jgi:rhamnosyltransferase
VVSIIIPTYNAAASLPGLFQSINNQDVTTETIIIDSSSSDNTIDIARYFGAHVLSISKEEFGHGKTRNLAASNAKGKIIVFLTQDCVLKNNDAISCLVESLKKEQVAASYGRQIATEDAIPTEKFARLYNYPEKPIIKGREQIQEMGIKTFFFSNVFSAIRRKEFEEMGGFPENVIMFEDILFAAKLIEGGYKIAYVPEAKAIHSHDYSLMQQFRRYYQAGVSFQRNPWFMRYAWSNKEGITFLREEIKFLFKQKKYLWGLYAVLEAMCKYVGYKLGLNNNKFPHFSKKGAIS